jgi:hypothetical protein
VERFQFLGVPLTKKGPVDRRIDPFSFPIAHHQDAGCLKTVCTCVCDYVEKPLDLIQVPLFYERNLFGGVGSVPSQLRLLLGTSRGI